MTTMTKRCKFWALMGILIFILVSPPILQIFNLDAVLMGIPLLVLYLHAVWILAIISLYALAGQLASRE